MEIKHYLIKVGNKHILFVGTKKPQIKEVKIKQHKSFNYVVYDEATNINLTNNIWK